ncbi:MAG: glycosyltransferase family 2 protein [Desulfobacterales bacterium]|jgi:glycosyltransferase involved in cell wall biosynthesis
MLPLVSAIIPSYNGARYLEQAVSSVINQKHKKLECIIVDDGSTDDTHQLCQNLMKKDPRIKYVYQSNGGPGAARNRGIKESKGEWVQLLDSDDWLNENKIKFQLDYFSKTAKNADDNIVLFSDYHVISVDTHQNILKEETQVFGNLSAEQLLHRILAWNDKDDSPLHCNNVLIKRSVLDRDLFNEAQTAFTDLEFFVRLLTHKVKFIYTPIIGMHFRRHPTSRTTNSRYCQKAYVGYLELLYKRQKELLGHIPHIEKKMQAAFNRGDKELFFRFLKIYHRPVTLQIGPIRIKTRSCSKFFFYLNLVKKKLRWFLRSKILRLFK